MCRITRHILENCRVEGGLAMKSKKEKMSPQAERTKRHLKEAYIELINEKGYSHVSVTDIVHRAQYNRATFYLYYLDKFHLTE